MWRMIDQQTSALEAGQIVDRVSTVSQQIYRDGLWMHAGLNSVLDTWLDRGNILVYCRPPDHIMLDPKMHEWKPYDTEDWKQQILQNQAVYMDRYDRFMAGKPCVIYDWTSEESKHIEELLCDVDHSYEVLIDMMRRRRK